MKNIKVDEVLEQEQISFMVYRDKIISFRFKETGIFDETKGRLRTVLRKNGSDDLLEDEMLENPDKSILEKVYLLKRDFISIINIPIKYRK